MSLKVAAVVVFTTLYLFLQRGAFLKQREADTLQQDKTLAQELARQIPELEKKLGAFQERGKIVTSLPLKINLVLSGIFIKDDKPIVLIGEDIYQKNDTVNGFTILEITPYAIILEDKATKEKSEVRLPE